MTLRRSSDMGSTISGPRPVFVIGSYRSGTSVFCWCLGQHPNLVNLSETNWIWRYALGLPELYAMGTINGELSHIGDLGLDEAEFFRRMGEAVDGFVQATNPALVARPTADRVFRRRRAGDDPKARWVDATPENSHYVWPLWRMFPEARFIHLLRDPHAVARSLMSFSRVGGPARDYARFEAYDAWLRLVRASAAAERALGPARARRVLYQELISNPEQTLRGCLDFIEEPWAPACVEPMSRRINSSGFDGPAAPVPRRSHIERIAEHYFQELLAERPPPGDGDPEALVDLERRFRVQVAAPQNFMRAARRRVWEALRRVRDWLPVLAWRR